MPPCCGRCNAATTGPICSIWSYIILYCPKDGWCYGLWPAVLFWETNFCEGCNPTPAGIGIAKHICIVKLGHQDNLSFLLLSCFPWLCPKGDCTIISNWFHIYPRNAGYCFLHFCAIFWCVQIMQIIWYIMAQWLHLFVCILCYLYIILMHIYLKVFNFSNTHVRYLLSSVSHIKSVLSNIFYAIYGTLYIQLTHFVIDDDCENRCTFCRCHHQMESMNHLPLFRVRSWNDGMCRQETQLIPLFYDLTLNKG